MTQTNMISFKQAHANEKNSCNNPFIIRIEQIFRCSLKTTQLIKIKHYLQRNSKLCCYHLRSKKCRMMVGFIPNKYKKCLYVQKCLYEQLYIEVKLTRAKYCQDIVKKKREFCLLILLPSLKDKVKLKYVEPLLMFIFSIVCFLLQCD